MSRTDLNVGFAFAWADVLLEAGRDLRVRRAEGAVMSLFGCAQAALINQSLVDLVKPTDRGTLGQLASLAPGTRLSIDTVAVERGANRDPITVALAALRLETPSDIVCVAIRIVPISSATVATSSQGVTPEELAAFAQQAGSHIAHNPNSGVGVVGLTALDALKPRLKQADAANFGETLKAIVAEALGDGAPWISLDEGTYAYVAYPGVTGAQVGAALTEATQSLDPEGLGADVEQGIATITEGINESDLVNGLICSLSRFCQSHGQDSEARRPSLTDFAANFSQLVTDGVSEVRAFAELVAEDAFDIAVQPIVDARRGTLHHYEALCRFRDGGSPYERLLFAERARMIHQFDFAMLRKVSQWLDANRRGRKKVVVAVNISGHSLTHPEFIDAVERYIGERPWLQTRLLVEITETLPIRDRQEGNCLIQRLRRRNIPVCIDDFGAGAASFQYLADMQVDYVKLDGSTVEAALNGTHGQAFLSALTAFCRRLGVKTIAEMVETREHLTAVKGCGVDFLQGYLFGRPDKELSTFRPIPNVELIKGNPLTETHR